MATELHKESKEEIMASFQQLLNQYKKNEIKVETKEQQAEKEKNKELLKVASNYTIDNIVNGMASLQLDFGNIIQSLEGKLSSESAKLDELKRSILVESSNLENLKQVRLVADALYILRQEHQEKLRILEHKTNQQEEQLNKQISFTKKQWQKEAQEFEFSTKQTAELVAKQREKEQDIYEYQLQRDRKIETDEYEETKRLQERELTENNQAKEKDWQEREKYLADNKKEFEDNKKKVATFEETLKQEYTKAKGEAIKDAEKEAKVKTDLLEKEWESSKQGYELKLEALNTTIAKQIEQIESLTTQLQEAANQARSLATKAFDNPNNNTVTQ
jgi:hypothetical protein